MWFLLNCGYILIGNYHTQMVDKTDNCIPHQCRISLILVIYMHPSLDTLSTLHHLGARVSLPNLSSHIIVERTERFSYELICYLIEEQQESLQNSRNNENFAPALQPVTRIFVFDFP